VKDEKTGKVIGAQGILVDITDHKHAEIALRDLTQQLLKSQEEERRRIARELHDSTTQDLVGLLLALGTVKKRLGDGDQESASLLEECMETARRNIKDLRTLSFLLHPPNLEHFGLIGAIRDLADEFERRSEIHVSLSLPKRRPRLSPSHELTLFRVLQESLLNIHRHSRSKTAAIRLEHARREIRLMVQDDGTGMSPQATTGEQGVGIASMRERLALLGGRLEFATSTRGTLLTATLPTPKPPSSLRRVEDRQG
jgi:signal transduction histidine kinase